MINLRWIQYNYTNSPNNVHTKFLISGKNAYYNNCEEKLNSRTLKQQNIVNIILLKWITNV